MLTFAVMLGSALAISELALRPRSYGDAALERERRTAGLHAMSHELVPTMTLGELVGAITRHVHQAFGADVVVLLRGADGRLAAPSDPKAAFALDEQEHPASSKRSRDRRRSTWSARALRAEEKQAGPG